MKKLIYPVLALLVACSSDDTEKAPKEFTFHYPNDKSVTVVNGFIAKCGEPDFDDHQEFKIRLTEADITVGEDETLMGYGNSIFVTLESESSTELLAGEYQISAFDGGILTDYDFTNQFPGEVVAFDDGTVTVKKSGDTYTLIFDIILEDTDEGDEHLKGTFKGKLQVVSSCDALF